MNGQISFLCNTLVTGPSGSGVEDFVVRSELSKADRNYVVSDEYGCLCEEFGGYLLKNGYSVVMLRPDAYGSIDDKVAKLGGEKMAVFIGRGLGFVDKFNKVMNQESRMKWEAEAFGEIYSILLSYEYERRAPVQFVLSGYSSAICKINDLANMMQDSWTCNAAWMVAIQNMEQLESVYGEEAQKISDVCRMKLSLHPHPGQYIVSVSDGSVTQFA